MPPAPTLNPAALAEGSTEAKYLAIIQQFNDLTGAEAWATNSLYIGAATLMVLFLISKTFKRTWSVNWVSFWHALVVGVMSFLASYLNVYAAEALTGQSEPLGGVLCKGPLTTFHSIVPAISMGYGVFDVMEGLKMMKADFIMHGVATLTIMSYFCYYGIPEIITPMLLMEISTINLVFMSASNVFGEMGAFVNIAIFTVNFTIFRMFIVPKLWWDIWIATWENRNNPESQACLPWHFTYIVFIFGMFFNCLNTFWMKKIIAKMIRKFSGAEDWKAKNAVQELDD